MDLIEKNDDVNNRHPWEQARLKIIFDIFSKYYNSGEITILDIGCGDIYIAEQIIEKYNIKNYVAVDAAFDTEKIETYLHKLKQKEIENIFVCKDISEVKKFNINKFDYIFLFDVIEHIENDNIFMSELLNYSFVTRNTTIFITVPAYNYLFTSHDKFLKHYRRYNDGMITQLAEDSKLEIINRGNFFALLIIPRLLKKLKEKIIRPNNNNIGIGSWKSKKLIDAIIIFILHTDFKLLNRIGLNIPGLSKFFVCKKSV